MEANNFENIKQFMNCENDNEFYLIQIIQRKKDTPTLEGIKDKKVIKSYYVSSHEYLDRKMDDIIETCQKHRARAYINLNKKNYKQICLKSLQILSNAIYNENYKEIHSMIDTACGQTGSCDGNKVWVCDVDELDINAVIEVIEVVTTCEVKDYPNPIIGINPTLHGYHILTKPFDMNKFREEYNKQIDIKSNNPTLLYAKFEDEQDTKKEM